MSEYFVTKIDLKKISTLSNFLINEEGFRPRFIENPTNLFASQFKPNEWENKEKGVSLKMYLENNPIYIKAYDSERDLKEFRFDKKIQNNLIKKIIEVADIEKIINFRGEKVSFD